MEKRTVEENCEQLFEYLRSTLYEKTPAEVDIEKLDPEFRKLGQGIAYTQYLIAEMLRYSADISQGNLESAQPTKDNLLCSNLKNLQSNLKHLTWQAKQVAKGDYTQHVAYLGEFSDSFNEMISQLKEREEAIKRRTMLTEEYNRFFLEVSSKKDEWIFILSEDTREVLYCNRQMEESFIVFLLGLPDSDQYHQQEVQDEPGRYYEISAFHMEWRGSKAVGYIVKDITKEKAYSENLTQIAYNDALTGAKNRQFFDSYVRTFDQEDSWEAFCFIDLDGLKYVNDFFGHDEGDDYIQSFAKLIQNSFRASDVFIRMGGDEFCLFCQHISKEVFAEKLERLRDGFIADNTKPYEVSFSYGIMMNDHQGIPFEQILKQADEQMYQYKKLHKKERKN